MPAAEVIARYFLHLSWIGEEPSPVTHLQLQKLLYYAQGWSLATRGTRLFEGRMQAWVHGPVVVETFPKFADYGNSPIPAHEARDDETLTAEDRGMVESIWLGYGKYAAWELRRMTHSEPPWKKARGRLPEGALSQAAISDESLRDYFRAEHERTCKHMGLDARRLEKAAREAGEGRAIPIAEAFGERPHGVAC